MNILVTGGAGFIGSHLSKKLSDDGHSVTVLDNLSSQVHSDAENDGSLKELKSYTNFILGDVRNVELLKKIIPDIDVVIHLAAETGTGQSMYLIQKYVDTNIGGTAALLEAVTGTENKVQKIILASSRAVYGEGQYLCTQDGVVHPESRNEEDLKSGFFDFKCPVCSNEIQPIPTKETAVLKPKSVYAISKQVQEQLVSLICDLHDIKYIILRYQNVYGPGQSLDNPYTGIFSIFSTTLLNGNDINIFEDGKESRDFVYVADVVDATAFMATRDAESGIYNVGSGNSVPVTEIVDILKNEYNSSSLVHTSGNYRAGDIRHAIADISKMERVTGFKPKTTIEDGIGAYVTWVKNQEIQEDNYSASLDELRKANLFK